MHFDPHFIAALIGLIVSEAIPVVTKSRFGGIVHAVAALLGRMYENPSDTAALTAQITELQAEVAKLRESRGAGGV
jgi:hypothetical protein